MLRLETPGPYVAGQGMVVPEPPLNPPEPDEATIERNLKLSILADIKEALNTLECRLDEAGLLYPAHIKAIKAIREDVAMEVEDDRR